jgi:predicted dehydrogenase
LHLDYLQRTYRRSCDFIGEDGVIVWDYISQNVTVYDKQDRHCEVFQESINTEINQMFVEEMVHFANCVQNREEPLVNPQKALVALKIALGARQSASEGRAVRIES